MFYRLTKYPESSIIRDNLYIELGKGNNQEGWGSQVEERGRNIYGDNYLDDYPDEEPQDYLSYWDAGKLMKKQVVEWSAVLYGAGLAMVITILALLMGFLWAQVSEAVSLNYSLLVDLTLVGSVLFGALRGSMRAKSMGLMHGALIGLVYSAVSIIILALFVPINWTGALETIGMAVGLGCVGGVVGINYQQTRTSTWRRQINRKPDYFKPDQHRDDYDDFITRP